LSAEPTSRQQLASFFATNDQNVLSMSKHAAGVKSLLPSGTREFNRTPDRS
jgi:hypothetical protein